MATLYPLTGDVNALLGELSRAHAWIETNLPKGAPLVDKTTGKVLLGDGKIPLNLTDGTFTVSLPDTDATDLNVAAGTLQYTLHVTYPRPGDGGRGHDRIGPFFHTAAQDLADLPDDVDPIAVQTASQYAAEAQAWAQQAHDISQIDTSDGVVEALINDAGSDTAQALSATYAASAGRLFRHADAERIQALLRSGKGVRYAALGDSTEAGVGHPGGGAYGEAQPMGYYAGPTLLALGLMEADPNFIGPSPASYAVSGASAFIPLPYHNLVASSSPSLTYTATQSTPGPLDTLTVYFAVRTADTAPTFDLTVNGVTTTVDTYVAPLTYSSSVNVSTRLAKATVSCPATASVSWTIDNLALVDRGSGVAADGTAYYLGATRGAGVDFMNYAVSSTTLLNASAANVAAGVTTDERIGKAVAMTADLVSIGWGTNDSKAGVSTVEAFTTDLEARIDQLRASLPGVVILLTTDPEGLAPPYDGNPAYNTAIRAVAARKGVSCIDVEALVANEPDFYDDDVHPSPQGYRAIGGATAAAFGATLPSVVPAEGAPPIAAGASPATGPGVLGSLYSRVDSGGSNIYQKSTATGTSGWHIVVGGRKVSVPGGMSVNRDTTTILEVTLANNTNIPAPTNGRIGEEITFIIIQAGTGSYTTTWAAAFKFTGNAAPTLSTPVGSVDLIRFMYDGTAWREVTRQLGQPT